MCIKCVRDELSKLIEFVNNLECNDGFCDVTQECFSALKVILDALQDDELTKDEMEEIAVAKRKLLVSLGMSDRIMLTSQMQRNLMVGEFLTGILHDLNNFLTPITMDSQTLMSIPGVFNEDKEEFAIKSLKRISDSATSISSLVRIFKDMRIEDVSSCFDLVNLLNRVKIGTGKEAPLVIQTDLKEAKFCGLEFEMLRALMNLVANSKRAVNEKFSESEYATAGRICLSLYKEENNYIIEIEDNGGGIDESILGSIFFDGVTTKMDGTGYGCFQIKTAVELHHGEINVLNSDEGAVFTITLPVESK